jgi:hypothetical protein
MFAFFIGMLNVLLWDLLVWDLQVIGNRHGNQIRHEW